MNDTEVRRLFETAVSSPAADTTDIDEALREGARRRRRKHRTAATALSTLGVAGVVVAVAFTSARPGLDGSVTTTQSPPASAAPTAPSPAAPTAELVTNREQLIGTWLTVELSGRDVSNVREASGDPLNLRFGHSSGAWHWSASDGCNSHFGNYVVGAAGSFSTEGDGGTLVACGGGLAEPANVGAVTSADEARIRGPVGATPARLILSRKGTVTGVYDLYDQANPGPLTAASALTSRPGRPAMDAGITGVVSITGRCVTIDGAPTIWPNGSSWSGVLDALLLPDGTRVRKGQTISGGGGYLSESAAKSLLADPSGSPSCGWTDRVWVFNSAAVITPVTH